MRHALLLALLAGCFSPKFPEGLQCGAGEEPCPPGQVCDNGVCRTGGGPGVDVPITEDDLDGDLVLNADDNCPEIYNPQQFDEERDGVGNLCDPCPVGFEDGDRDGDGVGDGCDPYPDTFGETLVLFEGFDEGLAQSWQLYGNVLPGVGELAFELQNDEFAYAMPTGLFTDGSGMVMAGFVADVVDPTFVNRGIGTGWLNPNAGTGVACTATANPDQSRHLTFLDHTTFQPLSSIPAPWSTSAPEVLYLVQPNPMTYGCAITGTVETGFDATFAGAVPETVGLAARSVTGRFLWMMYVDIQ